MKGMGVTVVLKGRLLSLSLTKSVVPKNSFLTGLQCMSFRSMSSSVKT